MKSSGGLIPLQFVGSLVFALIYLSCMAGLAGERKPESNAALQYWPALDAIPSICNVGDDLGAARHDPLHVPLVQVQTLLEDYPRTLGFARRGTRMPYCDWGLPKEEGLNVGLIHTQRFPSLAALFIINARQLLTEDQPDQAIDDLVTLILLGRHIASDGTIVSNLVRDKHEERSLRMLAHILPQLSRESALHLDKKLQTIPLGPTPVDFVKGQRDLWLSWLRLCNSEEKRAAACDELLSGRAQEASDSASFQDAFATNESMQQLIDEADSIYSQMMVAAREPYSGSDQTYKQLETTLSSASPAARFLLAGLTHISHIQLLKERQSARTAELHLLRAAITYRLNGKAVLPEVESPVLSKPPAIELEGDGFVLRSVSALTSEEVTFAFGDGALPPPKTQPDQVYPIDADAKAEIAAALKTADSQSKLVLVHFGGNWCGPCIRLHKVLTKDDLVAPIVREHYIVIKVNVGRFNKNMDIADRYGLDLRTSKVPVLVVLDKDGRLISPDLDEENRYIAESDASKLAELLSAISER